MRYYLLLLCSLAAFADSYTISTVAGSSWVGDGMAATSAILAQAEGIAVDGTGNIYISDAGAHRIRSVAPNGIIRTIAGNGSPGFSGDGGPASAAQLNSPYGLAFDPAGNLYVADLGNGRIRRIDSSGNITTVAGGGSVPAGVANEGSPSTVVYFISPRNIAFADSGVMYISDFGAHTVYQMATDGTLITLAGNGSGGYSGDGVATKQQLDYPTGLAVDHDGAVYIADSGNHLIRKVLAGVLTTIARSSLPTGLAYDGYSTLYVADHSAAQILEIPLTSGTASAMSVSATDVFCGYDGNLYVADITVARRVTLAGNATVIAGGGNLAAGDGGPAIQALLDKPSGVALDSIGNLYIADQANNRVRRVGLDGTITTVAGGPTAGDSGDGGAAMFAQFNAPTSVTFDAFGNLYVADTGNARIRMITPGGNIFPVTAPALAAPAYMMFDQSQNLYIADQSAIYEVTPAGVVSSLFSGLQSPRGMVFDSSGNFYFSETGTKQVWMITPSGNHSQIAPGLWSAPQGIALDASGNLLVADSGLDQVFSVNSYGQATPIGGTGSAGFAGDGASSLLAQLDAPMDIAIHSSNLYIADSANNRIRQLAGQSSQLTTGSIPVISVVNAASQVPGPIAPGMLLDLLGAGTPTQVLFNNAPVPILSVTPTAVLVRAPVSLQGVSIVQISVENTQIVSNVVDAAPALFTSFVNDDGTINSSTNPAARGTIISLYGTGEGVTGLPFSVTMGGYAANILYAGPSGNYPGMFQINVQVPAGYISPGTLPLVVNVGTFTAQSGLTITVF